MLSKMIDELKNYNGRPIRIMEVCGTHTAAIFKEGIRSLISPKIQLISGPGCPVCVTDQGYIDTLVSLAESNTILSFGDMLKVKGTTMSLSDAKADDGKVEMLYSPFAALTLARKNKETNYIFAAVGFETTAPIYALLLDEIKKEKLNNLKLAFSLKTMPPALSFLCENENGIDAFLCPGHVSTIIGTKPYVRLAEQYKKPFIISGFEAEHILLSIYQILISLQNGNYGMKNMYPSAVKKEGNQKAQEMIHRYFETSDTIWRGIGEIKGSGLALRKEFEEFQIKTQYRKTSKEDVKGCRCSDVMLGRITPKECKLFGTICTPVNAVGPCMVSSEGACGIWYSNHV